MSNITQIWKWNQLFLKSGIGIKKITQIWNWLFPDLSNCSHIWSLDQSACAHNTSRSISWSQQHFRVALAVVFHVFLSLHQGLRYLLSYHRSVSSGRPVRCPFLLLSSLSVASRKPQIFEFNLII